MIIKNYGKTFFFLRWENSILVLVWSFGIFVSQFLCDFCLLILGKKILRFMTYDSMAITATSKSVIIFFLYCIIGGAVWLIWIIAWLVCCLLFGDFTCPVALCCRYSPFFSLGWYSTSCSFYVVYNSLFVLRCRRSPSIPHYVVDIYIFYSLLLL